MRCLSLIPSLNELFGSASFAMGFEFLASFGCACDLQLSSSAEHCAMPTMEIRVIADIASEWYKLKVFHDSRQVCSGL